MHIHWKDSQWFLRWVCFVFNCSFVEIIKSSLFEVCSTVVFSIFTKLYLIPKHLYHQRRNPPPISSLSPLPASNNHQSTFCFCRFAFSGHFKWRSLTCRLPFLEIGSLKKKWLDVAAAELPEQDHEGDSNFPRFYTQLTLEDGAGPWCSYLYICHEACRRI